MESEEDDEYIRSFGDHVKDDCNGIAESQEDEKARESHEWDGEGKRKICDRVEVGDDVKANCVEEKFVNISLTNSISIDRRRSSVGRKIEDRGICDKSKCFII